MSEFDDHIKTAHAHIFTVYGDSVTYTPDGAEAKTITAVFTEEPQDTRELDDGPWLVRTATLFISTAASNGIESPARGDTVLINSETWTVGDVNPEPGDAADLELILPVRKYVAGEGHRTSMEK